MNERPKIPLKEGIRLYWRYLIPWVLFPTVLIILMRIFSGNELVVFWSMTPVFFACGFYAGIPHRTKNVTYLFWFFACGVWMLSFIPAVLVAVLLGFFFPL